MNAILGLILVVVVSVWAGYLLAAAVNANEEE